LQIQIKRVLIKPKPPYLAVSFLKLRYGDGSREFDNDSFRKSITVYIGDYTSSLIEELVVDDGIQVILHDVRGWYRVGRKIFYGIDLRVDLLRYPYHFSYALDSVSKLIDLRLYRWKMVLGQVIRDLSRSDSPTINNLIDTVYRMMSESSGVEKEAYVELYHLLDLLFGGSNPEAWDAHEYKVDFLPGDFVLDYSQVGWLAALVSSVITSLSMSQSSIHVLLDADYLGYAPQPLLWSVLRPGVIIHVHKVYPNILPYVDHVICKQGWVDKALLSRFRSIEEVVDEYVLYDKDVYMGIIPKPVDHVDDLSGEPGEQVSEDLIEINRDLANHLVRIVLEYGMLSEGGFIVHSPRWRVDEVIRMVNYLWRKGILKRSASRGGVFYRPTVEAYKFLREEGDDE